MTEGDRNGVIKVVDDLTVADDKPTASFCISAWEKRVTAIQYKYRGYRIKPTTVTVETDQGPVEKVAEWHLEKNKKVLNSVFQTNEQAEEWIMQQSPA
jgi:hypothetical protein